jgi:hypothetical protein
MLDNAGSSRRRLAANPRKLPSEIVQYVAYDQLV